MKFLGAVFVLFSLLAWGPSKGDGPSPAVTSIGLETGQRAPSFLLADQCGHEQTNESLKGAHGTVLLFFRSADW